MRVFITGATGFVGGRVARRYVLRGDDVTALVRTPSPELEEMGVRQLDGGLDEVDAEAVRHIDVIVHAAAAMGPDLATARAVNRDGTARLVDAALATDLDRFVHISTTSVYDREAGGDVLTEESPLVHDEEHASPYAITKAEAEGEIARGTKAGLSTAVLRPPLILGAGPTSIWGTRTPRRLIAGEQLSNHPDNSTGWVHVEDLVDAVIAAAESSEVFVTNVVGGHVPFSAYIDALADILPTPPPQPLAPSSPPWRGRYAMGRASRLLGIPMERRFEDAMAEIVDSWRAGDPGGTAT